MQPSQETLNDLSYVRRALDRGAASPFPRSVPLLWAAVCAVGFPINDFAPQWAPAFWGVASPLGFLASSWLGYRASRAGGETDRREGLRWLYHFGALLLTLAAAGGAVAAGAFSGRDVGLVAVLACALAYMLAGVHLARPIGWVGLLLLLVGFPVTLLVREWEWTIAGAVAALALVAVAFAGGRERHGAA